MRTDSKIVKAFHLLSWLKPADSKSSPAKQDNWLHSADDELCLPYSCMSTVRLCNFQVFWPVLLFRQGWEILKVGWDVIWLPCQCGGKCLVAGPAKLFVWGPKSDRSVPCQVPWSNYSISWLCQWAKSTGWDCLSATDRNSFCPDPSTDYCKPLLPSSVTIRFPVVEHHRNSAGLCETRLRVEVPKKWSRMLSELNVHPGLSFLTGGTAGSGEASWHSSNMGEDDAAAPCSGTVHLLFLSQGSWSQ